MWPWPKMCQCTGQNALKLHENANTVLQVHLACSPCPFLRRHQFTIEGDWVVLGLNSHPLLQHSSPENTILLAFAEAEGKGALSRNAGPRSRLSSVKGSPHKEGH